MRIGIEARELNGRYHAADVDEGVIEMESSMV